MTRFIVISGVILLAGCESGPTMTPAQKQCADVATALMRSPSSVKITDIYGAADPTVVVRANASNAYGTEVGTTAICRMQDGHVHGVTIDGVEIEEMAVFVEDARLTTKKMSR